MSNYIKVNELVNNETKTSPFAVYPGEQISLREVPMPRSLAITDIDQAILVVVNKYLILTSRLILQSLQRAGMVGINQKDLQHRLQMLTEAAFLQSARFTNGTSYSANKIYFVGYRGRGYLKSGLGIQPRLSGYLSQLDASSVKRYLSVNQYLINTKDYRLTEVGHTILVPEHKKERPEKIFRAYGIVREENKTIIVESVRKDMDKECLLERLNRMDKTLSHKNCNTQIHKTVELVLIAESNAHLQELNVWLKDKHYSKIDIRLSTDLLVYVQPENCLVEREKPAGFFRSLFTAACY